MLTHRPTPRFRVNVIHRYIPDLGISIPAYGIASLEGGASIIVTLSTSVPDFIPDLLREHLQVRLAGFVPLQISTVRDYVERIVAEFLGAHCVAGNLRYERSQSSWRWLGAPYEYPSETAH